MANEITILQDEYPMFFAGKLLLRKEIPLDDAVFQQLLATKQFTPLKPIIQKNFYLHCKRCGNEKSSLFGKIPCNQCKSTHLYCRSCIEMGRVSECEALYQWTGEKPLWPQHKNPCTWEGTLTAAQQKAADRIVHAVRFNDKETLIWAVCGAGKTEMLFPGITEALICGKRVCLATPRADVVKELYPRLQQAFHRATIQALYGGSTDKAGTAQLIITTTHQLLRYQEAFDVMIIDEIDAFPFHADPSLLYAANRARKPESATIYLTATPRSKQRKQIQRKQLPHVFVPLRFHGKPLPVPKAKMCFSLKRDLQNLTIPKPIISWLRSRKNPGRQLLIFTPTIMLAEKLQKPFELILQQIGLLASDKQLQSVHAQDPDRGLKVQAFRDKEILALITTTILERGVTFPSVDVLILDAGHDVFDEAALVQIAGRAGRSPDDPTGEVIFFHQGKTEAMSDAITSIKDMNKRGGF
ncbi:DEAD/DEAH box helicase [Oceanobacillus sp. FSL K6-2867]|uniref:DEAD/DEAH box helicase n=1 Tax=Oceanobacillus sp. FSL K6-2867 TaxID=2954748 RepID=UPI0030D76ED5